MKFLFSTERLDACKQKDFRKNENKEMFDRAVFYH